MSDNNKPTKKWYLRWWALTLFFFVFLALVSSVSDDGSQTVNTEPPARTQEVSQEPAAQQNPEAPKDTGATNQPAVETQETSKPALPPKGEEVAKPQPQAKGYQQVFAFSGNGAKRSEPFTISGSRFKVKYDCSGGFCQAYLKRPSTEYGLDIIMNTIGPVADETVIYGSGEYYIEANVEGSFTMTVEDYR